MMRLFCTAYLFQIAAILSGLCVVSVEARASDEEPHPHETDEDIARILKISSPSLEEARRWAWSFEQAAYEGKSAEGAGLIFTAALYIEVLKDVPVSKSAKLHLLSDLIKRSPQEPTNVLFKFKAISFGPENLHLLRVRKVGDSCRAIFRLIIDEQLLHLEVKLVMIKGKVIIADLYNFHMGQWSSEAMRMALLPIILRSLEKTGQAPSKEYQAYINALPQARKMLQLSQTGKEKAALKLYEQLLPRLKKNKALLLARMRAAARVNGAALKAAVADFSRHHGKTSAHSLMLLYHYLGTDAYGDALEVVERLDQHVGGDVFLNSHRAQCYRALKDNAKARNAALELLKAGWQGPSPILLLLEIAVDETKFPDAIRWIEKLVLQHDIDLDELEKMDVFKALFTSDTYKNWKSERKRRHTMLLGLVEQLGVADAKAVTKAERELNGKGQQAVADLLRALKREKRKEIRARLRSIMNHISTRDLGNKLVLRGRVMRAEEAVCIRIPTPLEAWNGHWCFKDLAVEFANKSDDTLYLRLTNGKMHEGKSKLPAIGAVFRSPGSKPTIFFKRFVVDIPPSASDGNLILKPGASLRVVFKIDALPIAVGDYDVTMVFRPLLSSAGSVKSKMGEVVSPPIKIKFVYPTREDAKRAYGEGWEKKVPPGAKEWYRKHRPIVPPKDSPAKKSRTDVKAE